MLPQLTRKYVYLIYGSGNQVQLPLMLAGKHPEKLEYQGHSFVYVGMQFGIGVYNETETTEAAVEGAVECSH